MATVTDVIVAALKEIGVLSSGETMATDDANDGLSALNRLVDAWQTQRLQIYTVTRTTWTISANDGSYTVGAGANVSVARPVFVDHVHFQDTSVSPTQEYPLYPLTEDAYAAIPQKTLTSTLPSNWYYNPTYPTGTLDLFPVPTSTTLQGVLYAPQAVAQFAGLTTSISLPPGYERMLVKNLAMELLPAYGRQPSPVLVAQAREAVSDVKRVNKRILDQSFDKGALIGGREARSYNIYQG